MVAEPVGEADPPAVQVVSPLAVVTITSSSVQVGPVQDPLVVEGVAVQTELIAIEQT